MEETQQKIIIYSYAKIWKVEKKIYSIQNLQLPVGVDPYQILYFGGVALVIYFITVIIPILSAVPPIIKFIALPYVISNFLMTKKLDGKNPIKYFLGILKFELTEKYYYLERFIEWEVKEKELKLNWYTSQGR